VTEIKNPCKPWA